MLWDLRGARVSNTSFRHVAIGVAFTLLSNIGEIIVHKTNFVVSICASLTAARDL